MHTKGGDKQGLWREKNTGMIDGTLDTNARKPQRELFNKALSVCKMLQGSNTNAEIDRLGVETAWVSCRQKVNAIWSRVFHYDILGDEGNAAVRTVYNLMNGKDTLVTKDQCDKCVQLCLTTPIATNPVSLAQPAVRMLKATRASEVQSASDQAEPLAAEDVESADNGADVLDVDDYAECYVCERCNPPHLYRDWSDYTRCARAHLELPPNEKHHFFKDQVRTVKAIKSDRMRKTSPYVQVGTPTLKTYSVEEKRIFLRERIIRLGILKVNDRIDIQLNEGEQPRVAVVVSAQLYLVKKSWAVDAIIMHAEKSGMLDEGASPEPIWVSSILSIHSANASVLKSPSKQSAAPASQLQPASGKSPKKREPDPPSHVALPRKRFIPQTNIINDYFAASNNTDLKFTMAPQKLGFDTPVAGCSQLSTSEAPTRPRPSKIGFDKLDNSPAPQITDQPTPTKRGHDKPSNVVEDYQLGTGDHIMLRDIAAFGACFRIPQVVAPKAGVRQLCVETESGEPHNFPVFKYNAASFIEEDYGLRFDGIYPVHIQHALEAFGIQETNRCFFLALGIATNIDPFLLQCLFRTHAHTLELNKDAIIDSIGDGDEADEALQGVIESELDEAARFKKRDVSLDCGALRFFWPVEFDKFRVVVLSVVRSTIKQFVFNGVQGEVIGTDDAGDVKKTIFLKLQSGHFTGLTLVQGSLALSIEDSSQWFLHEIDSRWRCPSIETMHFPEHLTEKEYVASAVKGALPTEEEVNTLWLQVTGEQGILLDGNGTWLSGLPKQGICFDGWLQQGSLKSDSWNTARNALVQEFDDKNFPSRPSRSMMQSPMRGPHAAQSKVSEVPFVFLDVGSESGRGLVKMLHDNRITHAAGVELQPGWFKLCVVMFRRLRTLFIEKGYRLPSITILQSCMLLTKNSGLAYLYATCSIALMNNEVFDTAQGTKKSYFVARPDKGQPLAADDVRNAPLYHSKDNEMRKSLSANAAYTLSKFFKNTTCIAVFKPDFFNEQFGYSIGTKYKVQATWAMWERINITIKLHRQYMTIADGMRFPCASPDDVARWQEYMVKWSKSLPEAYLIMRHPAYWTNPCLKEKGREVIIKRKTVVEIHSSDPSDDEIDQKDLAATLPDIPELQVCSQELLSLKRQWSGLNFQALTSLHPTKMLQQSVLNSYMFLLKTHFGQISFVPDMMYVHEALLASDASFDAKKEFCSKYLFKYENPDQKNTFIFSMNPGMHWIAFKIDFRKKYIATMCSLMNRLDQEANKLKECISSICPAARNFQHLMVTVPYQKNSYDCGPLCCMFMLFLAQNDISRDTCLTYDTLPTAAAMRLRIFSDISAKKLTILVPTN
jgi:hypothetical protein